MAANVALELDHHGVRLFRRGQDGDVVLGHVRLDDPAFGEKLASLRNEIGESPVQVDVVLPAALVLFLDVGQAGAVEVAARVEETTPCSIDELTIGRSGPVAAAVERTTLEEARDFARANGFEPASYTARRGRDGVEVCFRLEPLTPLTFRRHRPAMTEETPIAAPPAAAGPPAPLARPAQEAPVPAPEAPPAGEPEPPEETPERGEAPSGKAPVQAPEPPAQAQKRPVGTAKTAEEPAPSHGRDQPPAAVPKTPSRRARKAKGGANVARPVAAPVATRGAKVRTEAEALTVFGARNREVRRRSLTPLHAIAAVIAAGVLFAAFQFVDDGTDELAIVELADAAAPSEDPAAAGAAGRETDSIALAAVEPAVNPTPEAVATSPEAGPNPAPEAASSGPPPRIDREAVVWDAPQSDLSTAPPLPSVAGLPDVETLASLPTPAALETGLPGSFTPPPPPGSVFDMDERGRVRPTDDGALTPQGIPVHAGSPPVLPPGRLRGEPVEEPQPEVAEAQAEAEAEEAAPAVARLRPLPRPETATEGSGPVVTAQAADDATPRPEDRPQSVEEVAVASLGSPESSAFDALAREARGDTAAAGTGLAATRAAEPPPEEPEGRANVAVQPSLPTRASVADRATVANAIRLDRVNLIGVYGSASDRRALIRLPTGRYMKVKVGDRVDGGRIAAIQSSRLEYVKGGQRYALTLPNG